MRNGFCFFLFEKNAYIIFRQAPYVESSAICDFGMEIFLHLWWPSGKKADGLFDVKRESPSQHRYSPIR